jgi:CRP/FNR family cyclic AMP-dependent transcriptional regulator
VIAFGELAHIYAGDETASATIPLTQEELAELAGTSRATVNNVLRDSERGLLQPRRGRTVVPDRGALGARVR